MVPTSGARRRACRGWSARLSRRWATGKIARFVEYLPDPAAVPRAENTPRGVRLLDIGCGRGMVSALLADRGYAIASVDLRDRSICPGVVPYLCDAAELPFDDGSFDVALLLTVLHHTKEPEQVLREAARVARRIVVIEDTYRTRTKRALVTAADSIANLEFRGHPHSNRTHVVWRETFEAMGLSLTHTRLDRVLGFFEQRTYVVDDCRYM